MGIRNIRAEVRDFLEQGTGTHGLHLPN